MNKVLLSGRLTETPELKQTASGLPVCTFVLAVARATKEDNADFPTIIAWRQTAEFVSRYLTKGRKIIVEGELRTRTYENKDKKRQKVTEIVADRIEFADSKPQDKQAEAGAQGDGFEEIPPDSDLPF